MELDALKESADSFAKRGATLVFIAPQKTEHNIAIAEEKGLPFELLSDPGNRVAARYGLKYTMHQDLKALYLKFGVDLEKYNGDDSWTLPLPARMIIDTDGVIRYAAISADYTVRPDPEETLAALQEIV
jgi:peroxiredoxin